MSIGRWCLGERVADGVGPVLESTAGAFFLALNSPNSAAAKPGVCAGFFVFPGGVVDMTIDNGDVEAFKGCGQPTTSASDPIVSKSDSATEGNTGYLCDKTNERPLLRRIAIRSRVQVARIDGQTMRASLPVCGNVRQQNNKGHFDTYVYVSNQSTVRLAPS